MNVNSTKGSTKDPNYDTQSNSDEINSMISLNELYELESNVIEECKKFMDVGAVSQEARSNSTVQNKSFKQYWYGKMGKKLCAQGKPDEALKIYKDAKNKDSSLDFTLYEIIIRSKMAKILADLQKVYNELDRIIRDKLANKEFIASSWYNRKANINYLLANYQYAVRDWIKTDEVAKKQESVATDKEKFRKKQHRVALHLSCCYMFHLGKFKEAGIWADEAIRLNPNPAARYCKELATYLSDTRHSEAETRFEQIKAEIKAKIMELRSKDKLKKKDWDISFWMNELECVEKHKSQKKIIVKVSHLEKVSTQLSEILQY